MLFEMKFPSQIHFQSIEMRETKTEMKKKERKRIRKREKRG